MCTDADNLIVNRSAEFARAKQGNLKAPRLMRAAYGLILERTMAKGWAAPRHRVSLTKAEKLWVVVRYGLMS